MKIILIVKGSNKLPLHQQLSQLSVPPWSQKYIYCIVATAGQGVLSLKRKNHAKEDCLSTSRFLNPLHNMTKSQRTLHLKTLKFEKLPCFLDLHIYSIVDFS